MWPVATVSDSRNTDIYTVITGHSVGQFCSRKFRPAVLWKTGFKKTSSEAAEVRQAKADEGWSCGRRGLGIAVISERRPGRTRGDIGRSCSSARKQQTCSGLLQRLFPKIKFTVVGPLTLFRRFPGLFPCSAASSALRSQSLSVHCNAATVFTVVSSQLQSYM